MGLYIIYSIIELANYNSKGVVDMSSAKISDLSVNSALYGEGAVKFSSNSIYESTLPGWYYESDNSLPKDDTDLKGLAVAWAVVKRDDQTFTTLDKSYGEVKAYYKQRVNGVLKYSLPRQTHSCTRIELGLDPGTSTTATAKFYKPTYKDTKAILDKYATSMTCLDETLQLQGDSETETSQILTLQFIPCSG